MYHSSFIDKSLLNFQFKEQNESLKQDVSEISYVDFFFKDQ